MARDRQGEAERRNARARAAGWDSYGQQYRGERAGYTTAAAYQAAVEVARNPAGGVVRKAARGLLLGGQALRSGIVIAADWRNDEQYDQWRAINRFASTRRLTIAVEMNTGTVHHLGNQRGGYRLSYIRRLFRELGDWESVVEYLLKIVSERYDDELTEEPEIDIVTVTVV